MTAVQPVTLELSRLEAMAEAGFYNPYTVFDWPESIEQDLPWMSEDLVTLAGTEYWNDLDAERRLALTRHEAVHFFSLNVHGIRELLAEVVLRIHTRIYAGASEFLHHFIGEENQHMWFFAKFCLDYGGKLYPPQPALGAKSVPEVSDAAAELLVFARILIFEEIVDYFNARMADDAALPHIARELNRVHHQDESRHVAFGRMLFTGLLEQIKTEHPRDLPAVSRYLEDYLEYSLRLFYNPAVYRDAGLEQPVELRRRLLEHPARKAAHERILTRTRRLLERSGVAARAQGEAI